MESVSASHSRGQPVGPAAPLTPSIGVNYQSHDPKLPNYYADIRLPTSKENEAMHIVNRILHRSWGSKHKVEFTFETGNILRIYVNRFMSKYAVLHRDIDVRLKLAPMSQTVKLVDYSKHPNGTRKVVPVLFDVLSESDKEEGERIAGAIMLQSCSSRCQDAGGLRVYHI